MQDRVDELLTLWGEWMRRAPGVPPMGYPSTSIGGQLLGRQPANVRKAQATAAIANRPRLRWIEERGPDGKVRRRREMVIPMVPEAQPQQTAASRAWRPTEWPAVVDEVDRVLAQLTPRERRAVRLKYWHQLSQVEAAQAMGISVALFKRVVAEAKRFMAGYLLAKAA